MNKSQTTQTKQNNTMAIQRSNINRMLGGAGKLDLRFLTFTALEDNSTVQLTTNDEEEQYQPDEVFLEYNINGGKWQPYSMTLEYNENTTFYNINGYVITLLKAGDFVQFRARTHEVNGASVKTNRAFCKYNSNMDTYGYYVWVTSKPISCSGNIQSLLSKFAETTTVPAYGFYSMFRNSKITTAPYLGGTRLNNYCYSYMFYECTYLTKVDFANERLNVYHDIGQFNYMFYGCTNLTSVSDINLTVDGYVVRCTFVSMFQNCTSLEVAPKITSRAPSGAYYKLGESAYKKMFCGCTSLIDASMVEIHHSNTPVYSDNRSMFEGCTSLQYPPVIQDGFLNGYPSRYTNSCNRFFKDCSSLKEIVLVQGPITYFTGHTPPTWGWVDGVPETGDFFKRENFPIIRGNYMIPLKWRVHNIDPRPLCFETEVPNNYITCAMTGIVNNISLEYSMDGSNWADYTFNESILLANIGDKVYFRNKSNSAQLHPFFIDGTNFIRFRAKNKYDSKVKCSGNISTMLRRNGATYNNNARISLSLLLSDMSLHAIPDLPLDPGINLGYAFRNSVLTNICIRVTKTHIAGRLNNAFRESLSLSEATIYFDYGYGLVDSGLTNTFYGCTSLSSIKCYRLKQWDTVGATTKWLQGVSATGTFICCKTLDTTIRDESHIPEGWIVKTWEQEMSDQYPSVAALITQYSALGDIVDTYPEVAPFLDQYPNLVHSLVNTGSTPYMKMYGDGMETDIYAHEEMEMLATFETSSNTYSIDFGTLADNKTKFEIAMMYNSSSDYYDRVAFGDVTPTGSTHFQLADGKHTISVSKNGAFADGTQMTGNNIKIGNWAAMTEASNDLRFPGPIAINKTRTFGLGSNIAGENKFYELVLKEDSVVTHRFVPIANRLIADIGDLTNIKIYQCALANENQTEQRTSVFGLDAISS